LLNRRLKSSPQSRPKASNRTTHMPFANMRELGELGPGGTHD
jgi:hypothetical protein